MQVGYVLSGKDEPVGVIYVLTYSNESSLKINISSNNIIKKFTAHPQSLDNPVVSQLKF